MKDRYQPSLSEVAGALFEAGTVTLDVGKRTPEDPNGQISLVAKERESGLHVLSVTRAGEDAVIMGASGRTPVDAANSLFTGRTGLRITVFDHVATGLSNR